MTNIGQAFKRLGRDLSVKNEKNAYIIAIALALVIASALFVVYIVVLRPEPDKFATIYLLDSNKKAADYPEALVAGVNSTFNVYVGVENHMGETLNATVLVKITGTGNPTFPLDAAPIQTLTHEPVNDGQAWEQIATVSIDNSGSYLVAFELWADKNGALTYLDQLVALNIQVVTP